MKKTSYGIIVGRFQVPELHDGHLQLVQAVRNLHDRVIIFLGVSPTLATVRNPLDFITREHMIKATFPETTVVALPDRSTDEVWSQLLDERIREIAQYGDITLYGGRDSFVPHYKGSFKPVQLPLTVESSGEAVRVEVSNRCLASKDFRSGVIYSTQNRFPIVFPCVDIALIDDSGDDWRVLLGRKPYETLFRFPGGHVSKGETYEQAAQRELAEETSIIADIDEFGYLGSAPINDWRYAKEGDSITSALFEAVYSQGVVKAGDDLEEVRWFILDKLRVEDLVPAHSKLFQLLKEVY